MILTYKYRIKDRSARKALSRHAHAVNQVFNWCVAQQRDLQARYVAGAPKRQWPTHFDLAKQCRGVGALLGLHQQTVQVVCQQFTLSRDQHHQCPRFRASFGGKRALGWVPFQHQGRQTRGNNVTYLGKRYRFWEGGRPLPDNAKGGAFIEDPRGRWFVTFHVEVDDRPQAESGSIGIDLGLKVLAALSTGEVIENPRHLNRWAARLAIAKRSGNKRRARAVYSRIANARKDFHHKLSTRLAREYAFIAVGDVNAKDLAKTKMAKSVFDAGWSSFRDMLRYKAAKFAEGDERFTTRMCSCCGAVPDSSPKGMGALGIRSWDCSECGASHDRDVNAARNILALARSAAGPAEESRDARVTRESRISTNAPARSKTTAAKDAA